MTKSPNVTFNDGQQIPQLGYGVWQVEDDVAEKVVGQALDAGFRHIDTAKIYGNEAGVGRGIAGSDVDENEIFVTTKLWNDDQGYESTLKAFDQSAERLGLSKPVDLYLIHWAQPDNNLYLDTWKAMIELQKQGKVVSIGVSNFPEEQLREIIRETGVTPAIHQIELHPYFNQSKMRQVNEELGIKTEAWSPLGQGGDVLKEKVIGDIAERHGATAGQVVIAWHLAIGNVVIPKSVTPERIVENFEALNVRLTDDDVEAINGLTKADGRIGNDPVETMK
ncbi:aldo/keto reductase [Kocuria sp. HSID16901]|uniref:aldo/keto reductase n=1 Tax=Kocuria sp. HSID16901 TaxID=2419505 RepID=UPI000F86558E|nr:aldo/keto reductase [Kocuria sp. HSID16901]RUQ21285.1 aldo/keto reductase [Kocuria sp. HSID16901]